MVSEDWFGDVFLRDRRAITQTKFLVWLRLLPRVGCVLPKGVQGVANGVQGVANGVQGVAKGHFLHIDAHEDKSLQQLA